MTKKPLILFLPLVLMGCEQRSDLAEAADQNPNSHAASVKTSDASVTTPTVGANVISVDGLTHHIKTLASDEFGGRGPGTPGEKLTVEHLVKTFKELGLQPANGDSYTQKVPLTSVEAINKPALIFSGGTGKDLKSKYFDNHVIMTERQVDEISVKKSELVFVGYGINAPERNWNDYEGIDVRDKTVVILINDPGYATQDPTLFNGNAMTYYGRWTYKYEEATRQGAEAAIIIHDTKPAAYPWLTVSSSWSGPSFGLVREDKGKSLIKAQGWISQSIAKSLFIKAGMDLDAMHKAAKTPGFKAVEMNVTVSTNIENKMGSVESNNVAAVIKGTEFPDDVFIYMAHWDHLGTDPSIDGDGIFNGALDNATGTAGVMEIAKAYATLPENEKPKRSVMFMAVTAEEQGLLGSAYYAANPLYPLANTIGGINMDGLNNIGPTKDVTVIGLGMSQLEVFLEKQAQSKGRVLKPDSHTEKGYFYRSDHFELSKLGVPMLYPDPGFDHREKGEAYGMKKAEEYVANHYHGPSDEYDPSWVLTGAVEDLQLYFHTGLDIVNSMEWPEWNKGTEFKAIRDAQRSLKK